MFRAAEFPSQTKVVLKDVAEDIEAEIFRLCGRVVDDKYKVIAASILNRVTWHTLESLEHFVHLDARLS